MPGLFDNNGPYQGAGILSGLGNYLAGIAGAGSPALQESNFRRQGYNELANDLGPGQAALAISSPETFNAAWQRQIFMNQYQDWAKSHPGGNFNQFLYDISQAGQEQNYGYKPIQGFKTPSGAEAPGVMHAGQITPPPGMGFNNPQPAQQTAAPQPAQVGTPQPQAAPGIGGPATSGLSPMDQQGIDYFAAKKAAEDKASAEAKAQPGFPGAQMTANRTISRLEGLRDNPDLGLIVGPVAGRTRPLGRTQADLVNETNELQSKVMADTYTSLRSISGRPVSPGALKELSVGTGDLVGNRTGTLDAYKNSINNTISQIKEETVAAWEAAGRPGPKPTWGPTPSTQATAPPKYPEGTVAVNKQTGERRIMRAGQWANP